jgi:hypothetical protein
MLAQVLKIFWRKEHLVKNRLIALDKVVYFKGTVFRGLQNLSYTRQNRVEIG